MIWLVVGLIVFLGVHSVRIVADNWRGATLARIGPGAWKGLYSLVSVLGLALIVWGYGQTRLAPLVLWTPPLGLRHAASLLTLVAFVLVVAAYVPRNALKVRLRHPMVLGVKAWALGHLLSNGSAADLLLFGGFLLWAVRLFRVSRQRDAGFPAPAPASPMATGLTVAIGIGAWAAFAFWAHAWLIGVSPLGR